MENHLLKSASALLVFTLLNIRLSAQCPPNNITTNPDNINWSNPPYNLDYKKNSGSNRFDWRQEITPVFINSFPLSQVTSPYYFDATATALKGIAQGEGNPTQYDFYPEDGWELIRKNFGKKADGTPIVNEAMIGPYYILYNKYSSTLRVIGWTGSAVGYFPTLNVKLSFRQDSNSDNLSGLLSQYSTTAMPLDKTSPINHVTTPAILTGDVGTPFFADFKLAYDPCTCLFDSNLKIEFEKIQTMDIKLYGRVLATSTPVDQYDELVNSDNSLKDKDYLTSVYDIDNSSSSDYQKVASGMLTYRSIDKLIADYKQSASAAENTAFLKDGLDLISKAFASGSSIATYSGHEEVAKGLDVVSTLSDFFSSAIGSSTTTLPSVIQGEMTLSGQIVNKTDQHITIPIVNPGSKFSASAIECCSSGTNYFYPMYNEVLGVFALLETPKVTRTTNPFYSNGGGSPPFNFPHLIHSLNELQLSAPLKYVFNPAAHVNLANSRVYTSFEVKVSNDIYTQSNSIISAYNLFYKYKTGDSYLYSTPSSPIESQQNIKAQYDISLGSEDVELSVMLDLEFYDLNKAGKPNRSLMVLTFPVNISDVTNNSLAIGNPPVYNLNSSIPTTNYSTNQNITTWGDINITGSLTATSCRTSVINCNIFNSAVISAGGNLIVNSGASIGPGITLKAGALPITFDYTLRPQSSSYVTSFCGNGTYKANSPAARVATALDTIKTKKKDQDYFTFYPNPASSKTTIEYSLSEAGYAKLSILSISGQTLVAPIDGIMEAGENQLEFDTSSLPSGIYIVKFETDKISKTEKLVVIK